MTLLRVATIFFLTALSVAACDCGRSGAGDVVEPAPQPPRAEASVPLLQAKPSEPSGAGLDDAVGGGGRAERSPKTKMRASSVGDAVLNSLAGFFDGEKLIVVRNNVRRISCDKACGLEAQCGFRDAAACRAASCDGDVRVPSRMDYCLALDDSVTCLDAAACSCSESCWKRGECAKDHGSDDECERSCRVLVKAEGARRYLENRCVLESRCDQLVVCSSVNGP